MKIIKMLYIFFVFFFILLSLSSSTISKTQEEQVPRVTFNFVDVEIPTIIKFISELTGKNFIFDEKVKGKITIITPSKLTIDESFNLFTSVLELKGYTLVSLGANAYKIIPSSLARQSGGIIPPEKAPVNETYITRLLPIKHIKADEAVTFLKPVISRNGHISAFGPGNLLLVVDSALNIDKIMSILEKIDVPPTHEEPPGITVYPLENADATELSKVLEGMIKSSQALTKVVPKAKAPFKIIGVTPDKATNSLIIMASPEDYENILNVIKALDKRRRQVFVEAMIIEASIDKLRELGTRWRTMVQHSGEPIVISGLGTINSSTIQDIINGLTGFTAGGMGNFLEVPITTLNADGTMTTSNMTVPGFAVLFSLSYFKDVINVLSTPQILTSDNEEAEIVVGENVPFISKRERDITTTNTVLSSIERQDVGITLKITPQITEGGYVKLDIYQEISSVKDVSENILTTVGPTTTKRATKTSVVVKDSQTVVIGGLMQESDEETVQKVPVLGDIPIIGLIFKHKSISKSKTNLLVFLTPHIVKDSSQLAKITHEKHRKFAMKEKHYVKGELFVKFKEGVPREKILEILQDKGATLKKYIEEANLYYIQLKPEQTVKEALDEFSSIPEVLYAEPNYTIKIQTDLH
jgi:general secretion pathway protein D